MGRAKEIRKAQESVVEIPEGMSHLVDLDVDGRY